MTYILKDFSMAKGKRGDNNNNNDNMTNTGLRDDDSSSKNYMRLARLVIFENYVPSSSSSSPSLFSSP